jgi:hypothetical protein
LAKSRSWANAAEVASQMVRPSPVGGDEIGVRHAHARGGAVPGEDHVAVEIDGRKIRQLAVSGGDLAHVVELQLLDHVGDPAFAEALPGHHVGAAGAEHRPHRHLDGAGVRRRHDADAVVVGHAENFAGQVDRLLELGFADLGPVRAAESRVKERFGRPTGTLRAGTRRKTGIGRTHVRLGYCRHNGYPSR